MENENQEKSFNKAIKKTLQEREMIQKESKRICREIDMRKKKALGDLERNAAERQMGLKELQEKVREASDAGDYETVKLLMSQITHT